DSTFLRCLMNAIIASKTHIMNFMKESSTLYEGSTKNMRNNHWNQANTILPSWGAHHRSVRSPMAIHPGIVLLYRNNGKSLHCPYCVSSIGHVPFLLAILSLNQSILNGFPEVCRATFADWQTRFGLYPGIHRPPIASYQILHHDSCP